MKWQEEWTVSTQDGDPAGVISSGALMRMMHECAERQTQALGPSSSELRAAGQAFLVSKFSLCSDKPLFGGETVSVRTWGCPSRGYSFFRCYEIADEHTVYARGEAVLALVGIRDRALIKTDDYHPGFTPDERFDPSLVSRDALPRPEEMTDAGFHTVRYADCDRNGHLNNTRYPDLFCGFLPMDQRRVREAHIRYLREAPEGVTLRIAVAQTSEVSFAVRSVLPTGEVNAEGLFTLEPLSDVGE